LLGDARARGETHQWMWDRVNIRAALAGVGFSDIVVRSWEESAIPDWKNTGLERASDNTEYKPESLYVECRKPLIPGIPARCRLRLSSADDASLS